MQRLPEIKGTYDWFIDRYQAEIDVLTERNELSGIARLEVRRNIIERGLYVLMFGQFEQAVASTFEMALQARATNPDWTRRRGWDASSLQGRRVPFETKLAMVLDSRSPSFGRIVQAYATRNHCAHGGTTRKVGSIDAFEADLYLWHSQLRG